MIWPNICLTGIQKKKKRDTSESCLDQKLKTDFLIQ